MVGDLRGSCGRKRFYALAYMLMSVAAVWVIWMACCIASDRERYCCTALLLVNRLAKHMPQPAWSGNHEVAITDSLQATRIGLPSSHELALIFGGT